MDSATVKAVRELEAAQAALKEAEAEDYCCDAARKQAVSRARKQVKRWSNWLGDQAVLTAAD